MTTVSNEVQHGMFDYSVRPELIIHLATQFIQDSVPDTVSDAFSENVDDIKKILNLEYDEEYGDPFSDLEYMGELIRDYQKDGFLVQFGTPVPTNISGTSFTFSWGYYTTYWIYGDTYEDTCKQAVVYAENYIKKKREQAEKEDKAEGE